MDLRDIWEFFCEVTKCIPAKTGGGKNTPAAFLIVLHRSIST